MYEINAEDDIYYESSIFLGEISKTGQTPWNADIFVNDQKVNFKLESGADCTVISKTTFDRLSQSQSQPISLQKNNIFIRSVQI